MARQSASVTNLLYKCKLLQADEKQQPTLCVLPKALRQYLNVREHDLNFSITAKKQ
jgi:hypothetical protein